MLSFLFFVQGCQVYQHLHKPKPVRVTSELPLHKLERARLLQQSGDYLDALIKYREVIASCHNRSEVALAKIGGAECLLKIKKFPAALSILEPVPLNVTDENDVRKLALVGEILLNMQRSKEAEIYLEIAVNALELESMIGENIPVPNYDKKQNGMVNVDVDVAMESWVPAMVVNLGCAYLKNDKPEYALVMYQFASYIYKKNGDQILAARSMRMYDDLVAVIRQYEPFKPIPIAKGFSSGRR
jgi:tetratricopeptide (TPR) repeat protein